MVYVLKKRILDKRKELTEDVQSNHESRRQITITMIVEQLID